MNYLFESLAENVSEACFDEIIGIVEAILNEDAYTAVEKVHGEAKYDKKTGKPLNKSAELQDKVATNKTKELKDAIKQEQTKGDSNEEAFEKVIKRRDLNQTGAGHQDAIRRISQGIKKHENDPEISDYGMQFVPIQKQMGK